MMKYFLMALMILLCVTIAIPAHGQCVVNSFGVVQPFSTFQSFGVAQPFVVQSLYAPPAFISNVPAVTVFSTRPRFNSIRINAVAPRRVRTFNFNGPFRSFSRTVVR